MGQSGVSTPGRATAVHLSGAPPSSRDDPSEPAAVGVDLGSGYTKSWASGRQLLHVPTISRDLTHPARLLRRGRISDPVGLATFLSHLMRRYHRPLPSGAVVVVCLPVLATKDHEAVARQLASEVFAPSRVLFINTARAAASGAGAQPGGLQRDAWPGWAGSQAHDNGTAFAKLPHGGRPDRLPVDATGVFEDELARQGNRSNRPRPSTGQVAYPRRSVGYSCN